MYATTIQKSNFTSTIEIPYGCEIIQMLILMVVIATSLKTKSIKYRMEGQFVWFKTNN